MDNSTFNSNRSYKEEAATLIKTNGFTEQVKQKVVALIYNNIHTEILDIVELSEGDLKSEIQKRCNFLEELIDLSSVIDVESRVFSEIRGLGILDSMLSDSTITEIMVNGPENIFIERRGASGLIKTDHRFASNDSLDQIINKIAQKVKRQLTSGHPILDARLEDGSRVNAVHESLTLCGGHVLTIRKFSKGGLEMSDLVRQGSITNEVFELLKILVSARFNIFISGGTGTGKTTFLNALSAFIPDDQRIITIEDSAELQIHKTNLVGLEVKNANDEGKGGVDMQQLIKSCLRMRPDRIIVGEVRGKEAVDMLQAMNTGHDGSLSTGHANSATDMISRIETMVLQGVDNIPLSAIRRQIASAVDFIVHLTRTITGDRRVLEIIELTGELDDRGEVCMKKLYELRDESDKASELSKMKLTRTGETLTKEHKRRLMSAGYSRLQISELWGEEDE